MPTVEELSRDLSDEQGSLDRILTAMDSSGWSTPTPAAGWDVRDTLSHLCFVEELAALSVLDPPRFAEQARQFRRGAAEALRTGKHPPDVALGRGINDSHELLDRWRQARATYIQGVIDADRRATADGRKLRVDWFGPAMSPASMTTARMMEAWAHGVDVRDALGEPLDVTNRLRHICHIGFVARAYSFAVHEEVDSGDPVRVEVVAPNEAIWAWGPEDAPDSIRGPSLDMALVFTQRRHPSRTRLVVTGSTAQQWMAIAQAFAGPGTVTSLDR